MPSHVNKDFTAKKFGKTLLSLVLSEFHSVKSYRSTLIILRKTRLHNMPTFETIFEISNNLPDSLPANILKLAEANAAQGVHQDVTFRIMVNTVEVEQRTMLALTKVCITKNSQRFNY